MLVFQPHSVIVPPEGIISINLLRPYTCGRFGGDMLLSFDGPLPQTDKDKTPHDTSTYIPRKHYGGLGLPWCLFGTPLACQTLR